MTELSDLTDMPVTLMLGGEAVQMAKLSPDDIAEASEDLRARRIAAAYKAIPFNLVSQDLIAATLSKIACSPVTPSEIIDDPRGRLMMVYLSMKRAGSSLKLAEVSAKLEALPNNDFFWCLAELSGVASRPDTTPADPTKTPVTHECVTVGS